MTTAAAALDSSVRASSTAGLVNISSIEGTSKDSGLVGIADIGEGFDNSDDLKFNMPLRCEATRFLGMVTDRGLAGGILDLSVVVVGM